MNEGDLVHITQGVDLWNSNATGMTMFTTQKPVTGVFLREEIDTYSVYTKGKEAYVEKRHVYPMENNYGVS